MAPLNGTRAAIYARFSSDKQSDASIEDQVHRARSWLKANGSDPDTALVFSDFAVSGASMDRPGMRSLQEAIERGTLGVIVTESVDRISRDVEDAAAFRKLVTRRGVDLACLDGTRLTAGGKNDALMFGMRSLFAEQYRIDLADKTLRGLEGRARAGAPTGGVAFGYRVVSTPDKGIEINPDQAAIVRRIFSMHTGGYSLAGIATALNAEGVAPPRPNSRRAGAGWMHTGIRSMLLNESYVGRWSYGTREWIKVPGTNIRRPQARKAGALVTQERPDLAIVDLETFAQVQARFAARKGIARAKRTFMLSGILHCGRCRGPMHFTGPKERPYFGCSAARQRGTCDNRRNIPVPVAEGLIVETICARLESCMDAVREIVVEEIRTWAAALPDRGADLRRDVDKRARQIDNLLSALADDYSKALAEKLRALETLQRTAEAELANVTTEAPVLPSPAVIMERVRTLAGLRELPTDVARARLRALTEDGKVYCEPQDDQTFALRWGLLTGPVLQPEMPKAAPRVISGTGFRTLLVAGARFVRR